MDECPICTDDLSGNVVTLGCCKKGIHLDCLIKWFNQKLECPMCRCPQRRLELAETPTGTVTIIRHDNSQLFKNIFLMSAITTVVIISTGAPYF